MNRPGENSPAGASNGPAPAQPAALRRRLSLPLLALYGLGTTIGAGIYVLVGKVAGKAGLYAPVSFILACVIAGFTALSFAELASRYPRSAGEAVYVYRGFRSPSLALAAGLLVAAAGIVSSATIANGFVGYLREFVDLPTWLVLIALVSLLGLIAAWGIGESVGLAGVVTLIEIGGLLLIIWAARDSLAHVPERLPDLLPPLRLDVWTGVLAGTVLAFYAFIGFEDIVNVAEEVRDPTRVVPIAILWTLGGTLVLYVLISLVSVLTLPLPMLVDSEAPLADLFARATGGSSAIIGGIGLIAVLNGALIQVIMAARVFYGLSSMGWLPAAVGRVNPRTRTPLIATAIVTATILAFALFLPLVTLAELTSLITLIIFAAVNLALWRVKRRDPAPANAWLVPGWLPVLGFLISASFAGFQVVDFLRRL